MHSRPQALGESKALKGACKGQDRHRQADKIDSCQHDSSDTQYMLEFIVQRFWSLQPPEYGTEEGRNTKGMFLSTKLPPPFMEGSKTF